MHISTQYHFFCIGTLIRMDVVPDRGLLDFIDGLDVKEKDTSLNTKVCDKEEEKEEETDVWQDIAYALNNWRQRILDTECRHATSENFRETIEESLRRHLTGGCVFVKRDILELYSLR